MSAAGVEIDGAGLSASEYVVAPNAALDDRVLLDRRLGARILAVGPDRSSLRPGEIARVIVVRRGGVR